jgi:hypothetical protein
MPSPYFHGQPIHVPAWGGLVLRFPPSMYSPDDYLWLWTGSGNWSSFFATPGYGHVVPLAPDGSNRTFATHDGTTTYRLGTAPLVAPAPAELTLATKTPTEVLTSAWSPADQAVVAAADTSFWRLETEGTSRPGHLFRFSWPASGGPDLAACLGTGAGCQVSRVALSWRGVATGDTSSQVTNATISFLDGLRWSQVASAGSSGVAGVASATATITDVNAIGRLAFGPGDELLASVIVASGTLTPRSLLRTDDVSLTVTYRLP